jgi:hypothetical protein
MANTQRVEFYPAADAEFRRFLQWHAECHAQSQRLEQMEDGAIPSHFSEHVSHYRYARACAVIDREANPENAGIEAVRRWLHDSHSPADVD